MPWLRVMVLTNGWLKGSDSNACVAGKQSRKDAAWRSAVVASPARKLKRITINTVAARARIHWANGLKHT